MDSVYVCLHFFSCLLFLRKLLVKIQRRDQFPFFENRNTKSIFVKGEGKDLMMDQAKETTLNNSMVKVMFAMWKYQMKAIFCGKELWGIGDGTIE